ncbi:MAG: flagellar type III secretion system protein FlhB, partial [Gammaproteobacteria bacterium]|nr:flagellar type III secretion system protein FlhB [Gammaproteobacteria bacterium]
SKMGPLKGLQRIVGPKGFVELLKAIAKVSLIGITAVVMLNFIAEDVVNLGRQALEPALANMAWYVIIFFAVLSLSLILVAMIDVPFQQWDHKRQLRMSKDEIKQENKQQEGSPETKQRVRSTQREMAMRRMMEEVPKADVVITNPTHFAVALKYDTEKNGAPIVVAKGADIVAGKIRQLALDHNIPILSSPVLARAIFFSTELNDEIPSALYMAVAKILAYIYQLKARPGTKFTKPINMPDVDVPDDYRYDNE